VVAGFDRAAPRVEPYAELSQLAYVLIANYGLAEALPQPVPVTGHRGRPGRAAPRGEASLR